MMKEWDGDQGCELSLIIGYQIGGWRYSNSVTGVGRYRSKALTITVHANWVCWFPPFVIIITNIDVDIIIKLLVINKTATRHMIDRADKLVNVLNSVQKAALLVAEDDGSNSLPVDFVEFTEEFIHDDELEIMNQNVPDVQF